MIIFDNPPRIQRFGSAVSQRDATVVDQPMTTSFCATSPPPAAATPAQKPPARPPGAGNSSSGSVAPVETSGSLIATVLTVGVVGGLFLWVTSGPSMARANPTIPRPDREKFDVGPGWVTLEVSWGAPSSAGYTEATLSYVKDRLDVSVWRAGRLSSYETKLDSYGRPVGRFPPPADYSNFVDTKLPQMLESLSRHAAKSPEALRMMGLADYTKLTAHNARANPHGREPDTREPGT